MKTCLIIDKLHPSIVPMLEEVGYSVDYRPDIDRAEILQIIDSYEGLIVRSKTEIDEALIGKAINLKFVARAGAGLDKLDMAMLKERNITVVNAPEGNRDALAEHTLALILNVLNNTNSADRQIRIGVWDREGNRGYELKGKTVALIGYGYMGRAVANLLRSFGCDVIAYDKYVTTFEDANAVPATMNRIFEEADILSLHIPLTSETKALVNAEFFKNFKKEIFFINAARGEIAVLGDLLAAIERGKVRGAGLDVLENEKLDQLDAEEQLVYGRLIKNDRVVLTPHVGGWSFESYERISEVLADKITKLEV